jgi:hypothetical protein
MYRLRRPPQIVSIRHLWGMASRIVRFMRRQNLPGALCDRKTSPPITLHLCESPEVSRFAAQSLGTMHDGMVLALFPARHTGGNDHARPRALDKLVCLAVGASRAGHRHPHLGLDPAAAARASAEAALTPHFHRRQAQAGSVEAPTAYPLGHRFTHRSSPFADRDSPHSKPALVW